MAPDFGSTGPQHPALGLPITYLSYADLERQANVDLTIANGEELANTLATVILAWAARRIGHSIARGPVLELFDDGGRHFEAHLAPGA